MQVQAIAVHVIEGLRKKEVFPLSVEGLETARWALVDYGDVVVHIFVEPVRSFYDLEGLWADAPRVEIEEKKVSG